MGYSKEYVEYFKSHDWVIKKRAAFERNKMTNFGQLRCEYCQTKSPGGPWSVHHSGKAGEAYKNLRNEPLHMLKVLCVDCHASADERRKQGLDDRPPERGFTFDDLDGVVNEWMRPSPAPVSPVVHRCKVMTIKEKPKNLASV